MSSNNEFSGNFFNIQSFQFIVSHFRKFLMNYIIMVIVIIEVEIALHMIIDGYCEDVVKIIEFDSKHK